MFHTAYFALSQFLGCYFHQDFKLEHGSAENAINAFLNTEPIEWIVRAAEDLGAVLATNPDCWAMKNLWNDAGCAYDPFRTGRSKLEWLRHVHDRMKSQVRPMLSPHVLRY